jgi:hypothetical protein
MLLGTRWRTILLSRVPVRPRRRQWMHTRPLLHQAFANFTTCPSRRRILPRAPTFRVSGMSMDCEFLRRNSSRVRLADTCPTATPGCLTLFILQTAQVTVPLSLIVRNTATSWSCNRPVVVLNGKQTRKVVSSRSNLLHRSTK